MDSKLRSLVKSVILGIGGIIVLGLITFIITRSWEETTVITVVFHIVRIVFYYFYERLWMKIDWGKK